MLDFAEFVAINKFDRKGAADALRDVAKQVQRNRNAFGTKADEMPVFGTMASRFNDDGVTALYQALRTRLASLGLKLTEGRLPPVATRHSTHQVPIVPGARARYLAEIAEGVRGYKARARDAGPLGARSAAAAGGGAHARRNPVPMRRPRSPTWRSTARPGWNPHAARAARPMAADAARLCGRRVRGEDPRQGDPHEPRAHHAQSAARSARSRCPSTKTTASCSSGCCSRTCRARSPTPPAPSPSSARTRTRRACSPARATRSAPTGASSCSPRACRPSGCPRPSTPSRCTATTPTCGPTSTARWATPASASPRSTT